MRLGACITVNRDSFVTLRPWVYVNPWVICFKIWHLSYISLLIIPCMIVYVTNKQEPWTLIFPGNGPYVAYVICVQSCNTISWWLMLPWSSAFLSWNGFSLSPTDGLPSKEQPLELLKPSGVNHIPPGRTESPERVCVCVCSPVSCGHPCWHRQGS